MSDPVTQSMVFVPGSPARVGAAGRCGRFPDSLLAGLVFAVPFAGMFAVIFVAGCGGKTPAVAPVTGVVTRGGVPLAGATVVFSTVEPVAGFGRLVARFACSAPPIGRGDPGRLGGGERNRPRMRIVGIPRR